MPKKVFLVEVDRCGGCRVCELICSWSHNDGVVRPALSRIQILKDEEKGIDSPLFCRHCENPPCAKACPVGAISKQGDSGAVLIDPDTCIGCRDCITACPFGAIGIDPERNMVFKCDLCNGDPQCLKWCPREVFRYERAEIVTSLRQRRVFEKRLSKSTL